MRNKRPISRRIACTVAALALGTAAFAADPNPKFITQSYQDVLGRAPNRIEYTNWLNFVEAGGARSHFAAFLTSSAEYKNRLVARWYLQYLRRDASSTELAFGVQMLMNGGTDKQARAVIVGSDEYLQKAGGTNETFVHQMFTDLLGRAPSPGETNAIIGVLRTNAALLVENSVEFDQREATLIYQQFLRRSPTSSELNLWTQMFVWAVPEELEIDQLMGTEEYLHFCNSR